MSFTIFHKLFDCCKANFGALMRRNPHSSVVDLYAFLTRPKNYQESCNKVGPKPSWEHQWNWDHESIDSELTRYPAIPLHHIKYARMRVFSDPYSFIFYAALYSIFYFFPNILDILILAEGIVFMLLFASYVILDACILWKKQGL